MIYRPFSLSKEFAHHFIYARQLPESTRSYKGNKRLDRDDLNYQAPDFPTEASTAYHER
jgi:hypothetical protein